ncbi:MAG: hypothetical protein LBU65_06130 [Planctomycetaceae bacterium]|jgi:hypothetical protein|nr:hypothetical protein [Planctomycetaceae bacterium]
MLENQSQPTNPERRKVLGKLIAGGAVLAAGTAVISNEEHILAEKLASDDAGGTNVNGAKDVQVDALSGASRTHTNWGKLSDLKKPMTKATIKGTPLSRIIMGGNLIGGWAHSRDLMYVSELVKAYHTRDKIIATFKMGEACGINAYLGHHSHIGIMTDYWEKADGTMLYIADCSSLDGALDCIDKGAAAAYIQGETNDRLVREGKFDEIAAFVERLRKEKATVGLGGHRIETIKACVEKGIEPDFWMKTIHHDNYWSRMADKPERDNVFCRKPNETIEFMNTLKQPWIGFKVLAAGAIHPKDGFRYALESGADFMCVGMYDFQIVDDVNICMDILQSELKRKREWRFT